MKIKTKNAKTGEKFTIEHTKEKSQIRVMEVKKVTYGETL